MALIYCPLVEMQKTKMIDVFDNFARFTVDAYHLFQVIIGSYIGLLTSGNKSLPEPMLTQISVLIWRQ